MKKRIIKSYRQPAANSLSAKKDLLDFFQPKFHESSEYKDRFTIIDPKTCLKCLSNHGKVYLIYETVSPAPPLHFKCRCTVKKMNAVYAGYATQDGFHGADYVVKQTGVLPSAYITKQHAKNLGWFPALGNLTVVAPNEIIGGDIYKNRNGHRLIYSNDSLMFATYDHYMTFVQIQ